MDPAETGALDNCSAKAVCDRVIRPLADRSLDTQRAAVIRVTSVQHEAIDDIWGIRRIIGVDETWAAHEVCIVSAKTVQAVGTPRPPKFKDSFALLPPVVHGSGRNNSDNRKRDIAPGAALLPPHVPLMDEEHESSDGSDRGDYDEAGDEDGDDAGDTDTSAGNPEEGDDDNEEENEEDEKDDFAGVLCGPATIDSAFQQHGLVDRGGWLYRIGAPDEEAAVGRVQYMHGINFFIRVDCACQEHMPRVAGDWKCYVLQSVILNFWDKLNDSLDWLLLQGRVSRADHLDRAEQLREKYKVKR